MKKDLRIVKTKANLHKALVFILNEKTLDKISISELCKVASINRGTFYLHYKDVNELFDELFDTITEDLRKAYYEPYLLTDNKIQNLQPEMVRIFHHVLKFKEFYRIVFNRKTPMMYFYQLFQIIYEYIEESSKSIYEKPVESIYHASYQTNAIVGMVIRWIHRDFKETPEQMNKLLLEFTKNRL